MGKDGQCGHCGRGPTCQLDQQEVGEAGQVTVPGPLRGGLCPWLVNAASIRGSTQAAGLDAGSELECGEQGSWGKELGQAGPVPQMHPEVLSVRGPDSGAPLSLFPPGHFSSSPQHHPPLRLEHTQQLSVPPEATAAPAPQPPPT